MLGKHHIALTSLTIIPFLTAFIFFGNNNLLNFGIALFAAGIIASLIPDSDCKGKTTLYYRYPVIYWIMRNLIGKPIIYVFNLLISKKKISVEHTVNDEHRGIIHSPIGVLISSILLSLIVFIFMLFFSLFNFIVLLGVFSGLIFGQFLHLFQDSMTVSGINWKFPFGTKIIKGKIRTFNKKDKRPKIYESVLSFFFVLVILVSVFYPRLNELLIYFLISLSLIFLWFIFLIFSKKEINY